jgi:hypothetical protein
VVNYVLHIDLYRQTRLQPGAMAIGASLCGCTACLMWPTTFVQQGPGKATTCVRNLHTLTKVISCVAFCCRACVCMTTLH